MTRKRISNGAHLIPVILFQTSDEKELLNILKSKNNINKNVTGDELEKMYREEYNLVMNFSNWNILLKSMENKIDIKDSIRDEKVNFDLIKDTNKDIEIKFSEFDDAYRDTLIEGGQVKKYIEQNKRNNNSRKLKLENFKKIHGGVFCEVCKESEDVSWQAILELDKHGNVKSTLSNMANIMRHDTNLKNIVYNEFKSGRQTSLETGETRVGRCRFGMCKYLF